jgi:hypothetical protein
MSAGANCERTSASDFVGYDTRSDQAERRVNAAAELGIRWGDYTAVERR